MQSLGLPAEAVFIFISIVLLSIWADLFSHKKAEEITISNAVKWSLFWIALALGFYVYLWQRFAREFADLYLAGYVLEKTLSIDNLMVFMAIFASFGIRDKLQHRILYFGILGALVFRAIFVVLGTSLFLASPWVGFFFAAVVAWSAVKMLQARGEESDVELVDYSEHWSVRLTGRLLPVYTRLHLDRFFLRRPVVEELRREGRGSVTRDGVFFATPAFLCLVAIETSDIAFAFDSVPAVIAVTREPLLVYAAMIFAILGLRSLYFVLAALTRYLAHLEKAIIALLFFIAAKMILQSWNHAVADSGYHLSPTMSLTIILGVLTLGVVASILFPPSKGKVDGAKSEI